MSQLRSEFRVIETSSAGDIVEFSFRGEHESGHGSEMAKYICDTLAPCSVAAVVINLLDYEYQFGDDIGALCVAFFVQTKKTQRPGFIVATGRTHKSLCGLLQAANLLNTLPLKFTSSVEDALLDLRYRLGYEPA